MGMEQALLKPVTTPTREPNLDVLRELLDTRRLTGTAIAVAMGVSQATVSRWLNGHRRPTETHLRLLAKALGVPYKSLIDNRSSARKSA